MEFNNLINYKQEFKEALSARVQSIIEEKAGFFDFMHHQMTPQQKSQERKRLKEKDTEWKQDAETEHPLETDFIKDKESGKTITAPSRARKESNRDEQIANSVFQAKQEYMSNLEKGKDPETKDIPTPSSIKNPDKTDVENKEKSDKAESSRLQYSGKWGTTSRKAREQAGQTLELSSGLSEKGKDELKKSGLTQKETDDISDTVGKNAKEVSNRLTKVSKYAAKRARKSGRNISKYIFKHDVDQSKLAVDPDTKLAVFPQKKKQGSAETGEITDRNRHINKKGQVVHTNYADRFSPGEIKDQKTGERETREPYQQENDEIQQRNREHLAKKGLSVEKVKEMAQKGEKSDDEAVQLMIDREKNREEQKKRDLNKLIKRSLETGDDTDLKNYYSKYLDSKQGIKESLFEEYTRRLRKLDIIPKMIGKMAQRLSKGTGKSSNIVLMDLDDQLKKNSEKLNSDFGQLKKDVNKAMNNQASGTIRELTKGMKPLTGNGISKEHNNLIKKSKELSDKYRATIRALNKNDK